MDDLQRKAREVLTKNFISQQEREIKQNEAEIEEYSRPKNPERPLIKMILLLSFLSALFSFLSLLSK